MARKSDIDAEQVQKWARAGATYEEVAKRLGITTNVFTGWLKDPRHRRLWEQAQGEMAISLRSVQVKMALEGDKTMLIWLGKQYLGQKDRQEVSGVGPQGAITLADLDKMREGRGNGAATGRASGAQAEKD